MPESEGKINPRNREDGAAAHLGHPELFSGEMDQNLLQGCSVEAWTGLLPSPEVLPQQIGILAFQGLNIIYAS